MQKLILKFNAIVGRDHLPEIQEIAKRLALEIIGVEEETPNPGKRLKVVSVIGSEDGLEQLSSEMFKFPSITAKPVMKSQGVSWQTS